MAPDASPIVSADAVVRADRRGLPADASRFGARRTALSRAVADQIR
jgi:hypothetical protein